MTKKNNTAATSNNTSNRGISAMKSGAYHNSDIEYFNISTPGNASLFGYLTAGRGYQAATSNGTEDRAVFCGGPSGDRTMIDYITISTTGDATDFGDLLYWSPLWITGTSNLENNRGIIAGNAYFENVIEYITISTPGNAQDFGDLTVGRRQPNATSNGRSERGIVAGGYNGGTTALNVIDYITIGSLANAQDFGDMSYNSFAPYATSNA